MLKYLVLLMVLWCPLVFGQLSEVSVTIEEEDGSPSCPMLWKYKVPNGSLTKNADGSCSQAGGGGAGDVTGPGSSTDNALVRFHETTGKIIQDYTSGAPTCSDTGDCTIPVISGKQLRSNTAVDDDSCVNEQGKWWYDTTDSQFEFCNTNAGAPVALPSTAGDVTDVFDCASGDCSAITVESGDSLDVEAGGEIHATEGVIAVNNDSGGTIYACTAVYLSAFDIPSDLPEILIADADDVTKMPALGLVEDDIADGADGQVVVFGNEGGWDTSGFTIGDAIYVNDSGTSADDTCSNTLTATRPGNVDDLIQKVGTITRVHAVSGQIEVSGAGRTNDVPNLESAYLWVGNGSNVATAVQLSSDAAMDNAGAVTVGSIGGLTFTTADAGTDAFFGWDDGATAYENLTDAEAEAIMEPLIDTLANLTSIQSYTFTLTDPNTDAFFGWDDAGGVAYELLTAAEAMTIIGGAATDLDSNGAVVWGNIAAGELADNTVDSDDFVHEDWGEVTNATGSVVVDTTHSGSAHHTKTTDASELSSGTIPADRAGTDHIDTITEIAAALKDGTDACGAGLLCLGGHTHAGGADTNSPKLYYWPAAATLPLQPVADLATGAEDGVAPITKDTDTNLEILGVSFDATADEFRAVTFEIPSDVAVGVAVTITFKGYAATAAAQDVALIFAHYCVADGENWDGNVTEEALTTTLTNTQDAKDNITKSDETSTNLGWVAGDSCFAYIGRDGDHATDDGLTSNFILTDFSIEIPRA